MLMATPFLTCLNAAIFLRESLTWVQFLGGIGVVAGGVLLVIAQGQVERATPTPNGASPGK
jgi:drug/metabolite transporter (DMT)-like permease